MTPLPDLDLSPMLAKGVTNVPAADAVDGGYSYEPKWDGFRCIVVKDGDEVELASRGKKPLTRYFPELVAACRDHLPGQVVLDGEIVVRSGDPGAQRLDWEALGQRIHPAESRITKLSVETPAEFIAFDLLAVGEEDVTGSPFADRRGQLESVFRAMAKGAPLHLTRTTRDAGEARDWFVRFEGAGLDGVVAKALASTYRPGKRTMLKIKHKRTAEAVVTGYRVHKSGQGVGSLLLGLYDGDRLFNVGGIAAFTMTKRLELVEELEPLVRRDAEGNVEHAETDKSRFSAGKDASYIPLRPERVVEVAFDQLEGYRFRHTVQFLRWRPDRDPQSCTLEQIDHAAAYDLGEVLAD